MKRLFSKLANCFRRSPKDCGVQHPSIVGSWRVARYTNLQGREVKPYWKEVWTFGAMDDAETNGVYVCDYINLHTFAGKWTLTDNVLRLSRNEYESNYVVADLSAEQLVLQPDYGNIYKIIVFERTK
jgi:hypothetical protein